MPKDELTGNAQWWLDRVDIAGPMVEDGAKEADKIHELTTDGMAALHEQGMFRLLLSKKVGGAELPLPVFIQIVERIAQYDGSAAWCICQGNGCAMLGGYLKPGVAAEIWEDKPAGVLAWGPGKAEATVVDGGYSVDADSIFVSGSHHATWLAAHCSTVRERDGTVRLGFDGNPENRTILVRADQVELTDIWDVVGLRGTGTDGFTLKNFFVPEDYSIVRDTMIEKAGETGPLYTFTTVSIYAMGFASTAMGIAQGFLDRFNSLAQEKTPRRITTSLSEMPVVHDEYARAYAKLSAARAYLRNSVDTAWHEAETSGAATIEQRMAIRLAATHAIHEAKSAVDTLFDTGGTSSVFAAAPFERRFRDIHAVALQIQGRKTNFATVGAYLLGHATDL
ncbi:acyl-CoA dehydrogenase family protein, partial [Alphaproteobacteria bacterium]|nr:acyl-CoA dehydrogenase family protein [Alphaproteobacteria bacterium]